MHILGISKKYLKLCFCHVIYYTGLWHLYVKFVFCRKKSFSVVIVDFHRVVQNYDGNLFPEPAYCLPIKSFERILAFLKKYFSIWTLDEVVGALKDNKKIEKPVVAVTIDDGFKDNYDMIYPLLKERNIPATIFLTTGMIGTDKRIWVDRIAEAIANTKNTQITISSWKKSAKKYNISNLREKKGSLCRNLPTSQRITE